MVRNIDNELRHESMLLAEKLLNCKRYNLVKYYDMRSQIIKDVGQEFYDKYLLWHEDKL